MKTSSLPRLFAAAALAAVGVVSPVSAASSAPVSLRVEFDRPMLPADEVQRAIVKIALEGCRHDRPAERQPVNLVIVLDRSGSMGGEKIIRARDAAIEALHRLDRRDMFSVVIFDHEVSTLISPQSPTDAAWLERQIHSVTARGNTALFAGVSQGAAELRKNLERSGFVHRVLLLSDGEANVGPSSPDDLGRLGAALRREGISVTTVGLGEGFNEDLMTALAQRSDGNHYFVAESGDLARIFAAELGDVLNVVAQQIVVNIEFPEGVRVIRPIGREAECHGREVSFSLNQLYGGQEKFLLVEVEVPAAKENVVRTVARARARVAETSGGPVCELVAEGQVRTTRNEALVLREANQKLQADYASNVIAEAKTKAVALADSGRRQEAAAVMRQTGVSLGSLGASYSNAPVMQAAAEAKKEAEEVEKDGIDNRKRKAMRADSYRTTNQQQN